MRSLLLRLFGQLALLTSFSCYQSTPDQTASKHARSLPADPCTGGVLQAQQDMAHQVYILHSREFVPVPNTYLYVLAHTYHVQWRFVDSTTAGSYYGCYDSLMYRHLEHQYGPHFQQQARHQADSLDRTGKWYRAASFPGGNERFQRLVWQRVNWNKLSPREGRVFVSFIIDSSGYAQQLHLQKGLDTSHDQEVVRVLRKMPRWTPAYDEGKPYALAYTVVIRFDQAIRRHYASARSKP